MSGDEGVDDFILKFNQLNDSNQKYIMAVQQALIFAQSQPNSSPSVKERTLHEETT